MARSRCSLLGRDVLRSRWCGVALAVALLLNPTYQWLMWEFFHPDAVAIGPLLFAYWAARAATVGLVRGRGGDRPRVQGGRRARDRRVGSDRRVPRPAATTDGSRSAWSRSRSACSSPVVIDADRLEVRRSPRVDRARRAVAVVLDRRADWRIGAAIALTRRRVVRARDPDPHPALQRRRSVLRRVLRSGARRDAGRDRAQHRASTLRSRSNE